MRYKEIIDFINDIDNWVDEETPYVSVNDLEALISKLWNKQ